MGKLMVDLPAGVFKVTARGREYWYYQQGRGTARQGARTRLPEHPKHANFWKALDGLLAPPAAPREGTFSALVAAYQKSPEWAALAGNTQEAYDRQLRRVLAEWGGLLVAGLEPKHVLWLRDKFAHTPGAANYLVRALSAMITWSVPRGWRKDNPCQLVPMLAGGDGWEPWPLDTIRSFALTARPRFWHAAAVALYTGQRQGDCLAMPWHNIKSDVVRVRQSKTGKLLEVPLHRDLQAVLADVPRTAITILTNGNGQPWSNGFKCAWGKELNRPDHEHIRSAGLVFHGLRKSAVVMLLEAGCSTAEVAAVTGQSDQMVELYAKGVNRGKLAKVAMGKWERAG